ncbi:hypothetical protein HJC23_000180 [Cyclotella cryptica]|uniref:SCP domain-containing protein n=1 Tax=Cyclotella cryptica TaxID=29204 RepID=A0ABD3QEL2_9STRA|eukprot:CCRYP_006367-RA/>CCRYP_006367-RA protein AED:0.29 eAED:0.29 QI:591/1/1/1/1/1/4/198/509
MRALFTLALLLAAYCDAGALRKNNEGFDVVGGSPIYESFTSEGFRRSLSLEEKDFVLEEADVEKVYVNNESIELVDPMSGRRDQSTRCQSNERSFQLTFKTDAYGEETSYKLERRNADGTWTRIDYGPKNNQKYAGKTEYNPSPTCVAGGKTYRLTMMDSGKDGLCCKYTKGMYQYSLDGVMKYSSNNMQTFTQKAVKVFTVAMPTSSLPLSGRNSVCGSGEQQIRIELQVDKYGDENSWELRSLSNNKVIKSVDKGTYTANESDEFELCVEDGKYRFTIWDGTGDGICCRNGNGYYKLYMDGDVMVDERFFNTGTKVSHDIIVGYSKSLSLTDREQAYLDGHNWRREQYHEAEGETYVPLKWSKGLANNAANWAEQLLDDCNVVGVKHEPNVEQGENLAKNAGSGSWGQLYPVENIVRRWVEREESFEYPHNAHLTQALWRSSRYVGCAESTKTMSNGGTCHVQVCRYARAGNCNMGKYNPGTGDNWKIPMLMDSNPCGPACPPEGCF